VKIELSPCWRTRQPKNIGTGMIGNDGLDDPSSPPETTSVGGRPRPFLSFNFAEQDQKQMVQQREIEFGV